MLSFWSLTLSCSPAFEVFTQYKKEEILGKNCRFLQGTSASFSIVSLHSNIMLLQKVYLYLMQSYSGPDTTEASIQAIRDAIKNEKPAVVRESSQ